MQDNEHIYRTAKEFINTNSHTPEAKMVRKAYNDINCLYGIYSPHYHHISIRIFFGLMVCLMDALLIWLIVFLVGKYHLIGLSIGAIVVGVAITVFFAFALISLNCKIRNIYFYKHNGKLVTVHYHKFLKYLVICLEKDKFYCYNFRKDSWKEGSEKTVALESWWVDNSCGSYLLFPYLFEDNPRKNAVYVTVQNKIKVYGKNKNKT